MACSPRPRRAAGASPLGRGPLASQPGVATWIWRRVPIWVLNLGQQIVDWSAAQLGHCIVTAGGGLSLEDLAARLRTEGWAESVEHVSRARVPVVTFQDRRSKLWCDVGLSTADGHSTRSFLERYARQHAAFRPVCLLLKLLLGQQSLHKAFHGGVSSYRLYVLVAHILDAQPDARSLPAGGLLLLALEHYSSRVDWQQTSSLAADGGREVARFDAGTFQIWEVVDLLRGTLHALRRPGGSLASVLDATALCARRDESRATFKQRSAFFPPASCLKVPSTLC